MTDSPFHLAFPVTDLAAARDFYAKMLGCRIGRESERWIDFDFFGHQITAHLVDASDTADTNPVDGDRVPARHFGVILDVPKWHDLVEKLSARGIGFLIAPRTRFKGKTGEQSTMFIVDPSGNALEFKAFADRAAIFARPDD